MRHKEITMGTGKASYLGFGLLVLLAMAPAARGQQQQVAAQQITFGPKQHFFGYIGHVGTVPWNRSGRYIVALETSFQEHMPAPAEAADIVLLDTEHNYAVRRITSTRAWNFQQGTMLYWNPEAAETQFFFNDRDPVSNEVYCVLFDITAGPNGRRVREYRDADTPVGNSGVAQRGGFFAAINYGRLARLRPVTGYPGALDFTAGVPHPDNDGIFRIEVATGEKRLIVSYRQLRDLIRPTRPEVDKIELFINHTLWNRENDRLFFFARGDFDTAHRIDIPFVAHADGSRLTMLAEHLGGHPDWDLGHRLIGKHGREQVVYDTDRQTFVEVLGNASVFPNAGGDTALSPDGKWLVSGFNEKSNNAYIFFRRGDQRTLRSGPIFKDHWKSGELRIDPSPCWNRDGTQILVPGIADDAGKTRQLFVIGLKAP
jgi:hypothetical protein